MQRTTLLCEKCKRNISKSNFQRHYSSCNGTFFTGSVNPTKHNRRITSSADELKSLRKENVARAREKLTGKPNVRKGLTEFTDEEIFCLNSKGPVKKYFLSKVSYCCAKCDISNWQLEPITLELDHINGNNKDNRFENLRLLCPNCHSQTPTYKNKNKSGIRKVSDATIISALQSADNIRQALLVVGLQDQGANYRRVEKIIKKYNLVYLHLLSADQSEC